MPRQSDSRKIEAAKRLANQGNSAAEIAKRLGAHPNTVRQWAGNEIEAYKRRQVELVKNLALQGKEVRDIARAARVPERTVYHLARNELKAAVYQGRRKRWGSDKGQQ
jgi:hypothetical protein